MRRRNRPAHQVPFHESSQGLTAHTPHIRILCQCMHACVRLFQTLASLTRMAHVPCFSRMRPCAVHFRCCRLASALPSRAHTTLVLTLCTASKSKRRVNCVASTRTERQRQRQRQRQRDRERERDRGAHTCTETHMPNTNTHHWFPHVAEQSVM